MFLFRPLYSASYIPWLISNFDQRFENPQIFRFALVFKLQYLFFDLGIAYLLSRLFLDEKKKKLAFVLWILNPFAIYDSFILGHFDVMPTLFVVLSLFLLLKNKQILAAFFLGIGGALKVYPLLFLPVVVLSQKALKDKLKTAFWGTLPVVLTWGPFLSSPGFKSFFLFSPFNQKMFFLKLPVTGAEYLLPFIVIYGIIVLHSAYNSPKPQFDLWKYFLAILLLFFTVTSYHPQWVLWLTPVAIISLLGTDFKYLWIWVGLFFSMVVLIFFFEASLTYGAFAPISPSLAKATSFSEIVSRYYPDVFQLKSYIRSVFAALAIWLVYLHLSIPSKLEKDYPYDFRR